MIPKRLPKDRNGEGKPKVKEASAMLPVTSIRPPVTSMRPSNPPLPSPKTIRKASSEERLIRRSNGDKADLDGKGNRRRSKTDKKKADQQVRSGKVPKGTEKAIKTDHRKDVSDVKRKNPSKKAVTPENGSEGQKLKQPPNQNQVSCADCARYSDRDNESLHKNRKLKDPSKDRPLIPKVRPQPQEPVKPSVDEDETLVSVDADMPELALPTYVLPEGEFEDPAPIQDSSKRRNRTKE